VTADARNGNVVIEANRFHLRLNALHAEYHVSARQIVVCIGLPRLDDPARAIDARSLAESDSLSQSSFVQRLRGRFSILAFDLAGPTAQFVTDRFAVHPICYSTDGRRLAFSDRADSVVLDRPSTIDPQAIFDYLYFHVIPAPRTIFRDVHRLEAARSAVFDRGGTRIEPTWLPRFDQRVTRTLAEQRQEFRGILDRAVERQVIGNDRVGCFLSGGTDSSTVVGLLSRRLGRPVPTVSIGFDAKGYNELQYARIAAHEFRTEHHEHTMTPEELVAAIPRIADYYDQPFGNSSAAPAVLCADIARRSGIGKLLGGDGGDELFGGNTRYVKQKVFEAYFGLPQFLRRGIIEPALLRLPVMKRMPLTRKAVSYVEQALLPMPARSESYNLLHRMNPRDLFSSQFLESVDMLAPAALQSHVYGDSDAIHIVDRMLHYDWRFTLTDNDLPKVIGATRIAGIETGFPLLDDELVDFAIGLPPGLKVRGLTLRYFFKHSLRDLLPPAILRKRKHGFGLPVGVWLQAHPALRNSARDSLHQLAGRRILKADAVSYIIDVRLPQHPGFYGELVWILVMLAEWLAVHAPTFTLASESARSA